MKFKSIPDFIDSLSEHERVMVDVLRQIVLENLPKYGGEKIAYNVPYFYGNRGICLIWPASVPRGGIKDGVLLCFWYGSSLKDEDQYLEKGTNKRIYYKTFTSVEDIDEDAIVKLLKEAVLFDKG